MSSGPGDSKRINDTKFAGVRREAETHNFYVRPDQPVDFVNWSRESFWSAEEATALFFGLEPDDVNWSNLQQAVAQSAVACDISRLHKILKRAQSKGDLQTNGYPYEFAAWANLRRIDIPSALVEAISEFGGPIPNWDERVVLRQKAEANTVSQNNGAIPGLKRKISSLQEMCLGMALDKYRYPLNGKPSSAPGSIASALVQHGLALDPDTIRDHLAEARDANPKAVEK